MDFIYSTKTQRYRFASGKKKGRFVSEKKVVELSAKHIADNRSRAAELTQQLFDRKTTVPKWEEAIADLLKDSHMTEYAMGKPGKLDQSDYGRVGSQLRLQYSRLRNFSSELLTGDLSEAQILNRVQLYFGKTRESFWSGRRTINKNNGAIWERRRLAISEHCTPCLIYAGMGWQIIGVLPVPTNLCDCQSNCLCSMKFSTSLTRP